MGADREPVRSKPPRSALTLRDMLVALGLLAVVILGLAGLSGSCSFSPGGPSVDASRLPVVDAPADLRRIAPTVPFPVRVPAVPADWRANSVDQDRIPQPGAPADAASNRAVRAGFLTPEGRYLRLLQSDAPEPALLAVESGAEPLPGLGAVDVAGVSWVVYGRDGEEPVRIAELPGTTPVRVLITGSGTEDEFRVLAGAVATGQVLPGS
ncbi:MAG TPA: DUF4245 domain-containing protein [Pseudonocardia sp.]|nr:DUF4245 domain-containing protein [Pseudonocardia sp.]